MCGTGGSRKAFRRRWGGAEKALRQGRSGWGGEGAGWRLQGAGRRERSRSGSWGMFCGQEAVGEGWGLFLVSRSSEGCPDF